MASAIRDWLSHAWFMHLLAEQRSVMRGCGIINCRHLLESYIFNQQLNSTIIMLAKAFLHVNVYRCSLDITIPIPIY